MFLFYDRIIPIHDIFDNHAVIDVAPLVLMYVVVVVGYDPS